MKKSLFSFMAILLLSSTPALADVPMSYMHQGLLKENDALVNGTREIKAEIIDESGNVVGSRTAPVEIKAGAYSLEIKNVNVDQVAAAKELQLRVTIDGETLSPALKVNSVPYATVAYLAKTVNTTSQIGSGLHRYSKDGAVQNDLTIEASEHCPCDKSDNSWDCGEDFSTTDYNEEGCYDVYGAGYQRYSRELVIRPLDVVAIESTMVGIGTTQPDAPLHILSDNGETGSADLHIAGPNPTILLDDLDGKSVSVVANDGTLDINGNVDAADFGEKLLRRVLDRTYPIDSIFTTMSKTMDTAEKVAAVLGGKWEQLEPDVVLWTVGKNGAVGTKIPAGLPNITGYGPIFSNEVITNRNEGAFITDTSRSFSGWDGQSGGTFSNSFRFDAEAGRKYWHKSQYSEEVKDTIYGNSTTVQPPAIQVYMYRRLE